MNIINDIIVNQGIIEEILKAGFAHMDEESPMLKKPIITRRMSADQESVVWSAYLLEQNEGAIEEAETEGEYIVHMGKARSFVSLNNMDQFIQIGTNWSFNHLAAIEFYLSL